MHRKPHNLQRNFNLRLRGRLRNGRVRDMANLTGAMRFVVAIAVIVGNNLRAKDEYRQHERYGQEAEGKTPVHFKISGQDSPAGMVLRYCFA